MQTTLLQGLNPALKIQLEVQTPALLNSALSPALQIPERDPPLPPSPVWQYTEPKVVQQQHLTSPEREPVKAVEQCSPRGSNQGTHAGPEHCQPALATQDTSHVIELVML